MEQISITSSGGNTSDTPSSAGSSFTPPTPVQSSDINCIDKRLQAVSESESQDEKHDEPDQMYLSGSSGSEEKLLEVKSFGLEQDDLCDPNTRLNSTFLKAANDTDTEQNIEDDHNIIRQLEALIQASAYILRPSSNITRQLEALDQALGPILRPSNEAAAALPQMRTEPKNENKALVKVCHDGDINVRKLLGEDQSVHETSEEGESLLSLACSAGFYELAQFLSAMQANVENRGIKGHCTPLMVAASSGFVEIVKLLIQRGAVVNALSSTGNTPLMYACTGGHVETVKLLLENGANVDDHNENGHTPLMIAASAGHVMVAKILLNHGASINSQLNEFKESALTLACYKGHLEMVRFLLDAGADQASVIDLMLLKILVSSMDCLDNLSKTLKHVVWGITTELLKVTDMFFTEYQQDQQSNLGHSLDMSETRELCNYVPTIRSRKTQPEDKSDNVDLISVPSLGDLFDSKMIKAKTKIIKIFLTAANKIYLTEEFGDL